MPNFSSNKVISIEDFTAPELVPYIQTIAYDEMIRFGLESVPTVPDSKQWECAMMLRTFDKFGLLRNGALMAGVGAGTEQTTFALASKGCVTFPTDRYLEVTPWSDVAPATMMVRPRQYTMFDYPAGHVIPVHSDARAAELPSDFFDGVYSAGSIEHFGSLDAVAAAAEEIGRILKPGGIAAISTEFRLEGPNERGWFDDSCILFTPDLIQKYIVEPSGLQLIDPLVTKPSAKTFDSRVVLTEFLAKATKIKSIQDKEDAYPNLVLFHDGFLFCSVHLALRKPESAVHTPTVHYGSMFREAVLADATAASGVLTEQIVQWKERFGRDDDELVMKSKRVAELQVRVADLTTAAERLAEVEQILVTILERDKSGDVVRLLDASGAPRPSLAWQQLNEWEADKIYSVIGERQNKVLSSQGKQGFLCFGPYITLPKGRYMVEFDCLVATPDTGKVLADICYAQASEVAGTVEVPVVSLASVGEPKNPIRLEFTLLDTAQEVEFRFQSLSDSIVSVGGIRLFSKTIAIQ